MGLAFESLLVLILGRERSPDLPNGFLNWLGAFFHIPDTYVLNHESIDGYLLLRYLKICVAICFVGCCITWPVLFPINATGGAGEKQLDLLTFGNVANKQRYYAHTFVGWIFFSRSLVRMLLGLILVLTYGVKALCST